MRWVVLILALAGAGGSGYLGFRWFSDAEAKKTQINLIRQLAKTSPTAQAEVNRFETSRNASFFLMASALLGFIGSLLAISRRGILAALVLIVAFAGPVVLCKDWLLEKTDNLMGFAIWTGALVLAGLLAFLIRGKKVIPEDERAYAGV
jgi:hypothetical protein